MSSQNSTPSWANNTVPTASNWDKNPPAPAAGAPGGTDSSAAPLPAGAKPANNGWGNAPSPAASSGWGNESKVGTGSGNIAEGCGNSNANNNDNSNPNSNAQSGPNNNAANADGNKAGQGDGGFSFSTEPAKAPEEEGEAYFNPEDPHGLREPEFDVNVKLADLQADPDNPLYSVKSFQDLNLRPELLQGLATMNFRKPSKIQERALPLLLKDPPQNLIGQSQSGTGKTAAFVLNMLSRIDLSNNEPQCLVLSPTRELARQISSVASTMGMFLVDEGLQVTEAIPQMVPRGKQLEGQIIVGTPGTVMDMLKRRQLSTRGLRVLTLDEADTMLDLQGLGDSCKRVKAMLPRDVQVVLFSATFPPEVLEFANFFAPNANELTLEVEKLTVKGIKQLYLDVPSAEEKYYALIKFYGVMTIASSIIFVARRDTAAELERRMTAEGHSVASLSGALEGRQRDEVFNRFRSGEAKVLITTNVLSRGIDVQTVTMVINYDLPMTVDRQPDFETYLHRIGRTGRFGRTGVALSLVHDRRSWEALMAICGHFKVEPTLLNPTDLEGTEKMLKRIMRNSRNASIAGPLLKPEDEEEEEEEKE
ncbi:P-loop containing nucleoside triphosphate hydrolase protein [Piedraia hortae CBS 480.64]|uniref:RNA helicase n=1 Tax=Piedraia hortae CBS 480.64 TaxID=1314780 RepID=A0A6A7BUJ5_9PEZI|nr:P-loop containing nucleoside triphosphate hydrolase protein [Piedraia hortae CBS 480.64]